MYRSASKDNHAIIKTILCYASTDRHSTGSSLLTWEQSQKFITKPLTAVKDLKKVKHLLTDCLGTQVIEKDESESSAVNEGTKSLSSAIVKCINFGWKSIQFEVKSSVRYWTLNESQYEMKSQCNTMPCSLWPMKLSRVGVTVFCRTYWNIEGWI